MNTTRRDFLKVGAGAVAATSAVSANSNEELPLYSIREISGSAGGGRGQHDLSEVWTHGCAHFRYRGGWSSSRRCADVGRGGATRP
jgi:hypothetical protein